MAYTINVQNTVTNVTVVEVNSVIDVTAPDAANFIVTTTNYLVGVVNTLSTVTVYTDAVELLVDDFANYFLGDWQSGTTYRRGQLVDYAYSLYVCSTGTYSNLVSTVNPAVDNAPDRWRRVVWHEAPFDHITVTNTSNLLGDVNIGGNLDANGNLDVAGNALLSGNASIDGTLTLARALDHLTITNHLSAGTLSVGSIDSTGPVLISGALEVDGNVFANQELAVQNTATFFGDVKIPNSNLLVNNLTVTNTASILGSLNVGDINGSGGVNIAGALNAQGSSTFSTSTFNEPVAFNDYTTFNSTASFLKLSTNELTVANVRYPTTQGLYGQVISNMGDNTAQWRNLGDLNFWSLNDDLKTNGFDIKTGSRSSELNLYNGNTFGDNSSSIKLGNEFIEVDTQVIRLDAGNASIHLGPSSITLDSSDTTRINSNIVTILDAPTIRIYGTLRGNPSTNDRVHLGPNGLEFNDGTRLTTAFPDISGILPIASSTVLGGIKVGSGLQISGVSGVLNATYSYTLPTASSTVLGGIKVGAGLAINSGVLSVSGGGTGTVSTSTVSLGSDMYTNGYDIAFNQENYTSRINIGQYNIGVSTQGDISFDCDQVDIQGGSGPIEMRLDVGSKIRLDNSKITIEDPTQVLINSPEVTIGDQLTGFTNIGELRVNKIYNYAGTYAPFFPAGVQYADSTVQITAYHPDGGPLPAV